MPVAAFILAVGDGASAGPLERHAEPALHVGDTL
jgi:hypothetical protein